MAHTGAVQRVCMLRVRVLVLAFVIAALLLIALSRQAESVEVDTRSIKDLMSNLYYAPPESSTNLHQPRSRADTRPQALLPSSADSTDRRPHLAHVQLPTPMVNSPPPLQRIAPQQAPHHRTTAPPPSSRLGAPPSPFCVGVIASDACNQWYANRDLPESSFAPQIWQVMCGPNWFIVCLLTCTLSPARRSQEHGDRRRRRWIAKKVNPRLARCCCVSNHARMCHALVRHGLPALSAPPALGSFRCPSRAHVIPLSPYPLTHQLLVPCMLCIASAPLSATGCHGRGICDKSSGVCLCKAGFNGTSCGKATVRVCNAPSDGHWVAR